MAPGTSVHRGAQFIRQWRLLRALEGAKRGMTAAQLKDAIEETQSTRTLYRDLEVLEQSGFPLTNEGGRWRLLETSESSWAIPVNPTEVVALMLTEDLLAPVEGSWLAEPLLSRNPSPRLMQLPAGNSSVVRRGASDRRPCHLLRCHSSDRRS